jgi:histidinol-phosphate/aromatic aminotransferase/cobyric acid decarboxylase-like protein
MVAEMKAYFPALLASYPSGQSVQNLLGAKLFNREESTVLVGNGAAELIRALSPSLTGSIGVILPTFNEYPESFAANPLVTFTPDDFAYTGADLLAFSKGCDNLLLINPDNPSGNCISRGEVLRLAGALKEQGKRLILDESFVDFADRDPSPTLLREDVIEAHPNLVGIKSLSKSYGVPGIRLGILATADAPLLAAVRSRLPIWNINSFGEYFLQIVGKYGSDYRASCAAIAAERKRFARALADTGLLHVYPSEANYLLCRILGTETAPALTERLLWGYQILIKDLTGKPGITGSRHIRLAVRTPEENDHLVAALTGEMR